LSNGPLAGIVSRANLVQAVAAAKAPSATLADKDRWTRLGILAKLAEQSRTDFGDRNIIVVDGTAHIWGLVGSPQGRKALTSLVEGVPGVTSVRDEMIAAY
jgi:osmotically-inducible protein OsmY